MNDDLDKLMGVMDAAFDPHWREAWTRRQVADSLLMPNCYMILAGLDGMMPGEDEAASGFVLARHSGGEDELLLVAVSPDARGRGIGTRLLARFEDEARRRGSQRLFLEMRANNPAECLYRACGYAPIGRRPQYYRTATGETIDAVTFGKDLD